MGDVICGVCWCVCVRSFFVCVQGTFWSVSVCVSLTMLLGTLRPCATHSLTFFWMAVKASVPTYCIRSLELARHVTFPNLRHKARHERNMPQYYR